jgi:hypothetical protein
LYGGAVKLYTFTLQDLYYFPSLWRGDHYLGVDAEADAKDEQKQQQLQQQQKG